MSEFIQQQRQAFNEAFQDDRTTIIIAGPCSITEDLEAANLDGFLLDEFGRKTSDVMTVRRLNPWKPRSNPADWHGLETTNPSVAMDIIQDANAFGDKVAMEFGLPEHLGRYGHLTTLGWIGSRNAVQTHFIEQVATEDHSLPLAIKNGMEGDVDHILELTESVGKVRGYGAPVIPIFRGGSDLKTPEAWEDAFIRMSEATEGRFIVDSAHGTEMAHDPSQKFGKTVAGQLVALEHIFELIEEGHPVKAIMTEASLTDSPTDPNIPMHKYLAALNQNLGALRS